MAWVCFEGGNPCLNCFCHTSEKVSTLKGKNLRSFGESFCPFTVTFLEGA